MTTTKTKPIVYSGEGSAVDSYNNQQKELLNFVQGGWDYSLNWGGFKKSHPLYSTHQKIFSLCIQKEWSKPNEKHGVVADTYKLGEFFKSKYSPVNKPLMEMTQKELEKIIEALGGIVVHHWDKKSRNR